MSSSRDPNREFPAIPATANQLLTDPTLMSLPDLPLELIQHILREGSGTKPFSLQVMSGLASGNKTLQTFFKPHMPTVLLQKVLQGNHDKIVAMAKINPSYFFVKSTAQDYAMDFDGNRRTYEDWSPYQALFATGAVDTLAVIKPYLDRYLATLKDGNKLAKNQEQEKFASGFGFPSSTYDFSALVLAIGRDEQLKEDSKQPSRATLDKLEQFRKDFKPATIKTGHAFNLNDFIRAHEVYDANKNRWTYHQLNFFAVNVIGYLERMLTAPYLQAACQGLDNIINKSKPLVHHFEITNFGDEKITIADNNSGLSRRLGRDIFIDSHLGLEADVCDPSTVVQSWRLLSSNLSEALKAYAHTQTTSRRHQVRSHCVIS